MESEREREMRDGLRLLDSSVFPIILWSCRLSYPCRLAHLLYSISLQSTLRFLLLCTQSNQVLATLQQYYHVFHTHLTSLNCFNIISETYNFAAKKNV